MTTDKSGRTSAGILLWRHRNDRLEVLLAHQGGPHWVNKDLGHWTIPKGEVEQAEELVAVARREFAEETGHQLPDTPLVELGEIRQKSGKLVLAWAARGDLDAATAVSNTYQMEWPPRSGRVETFPEIDRVEWFTLNQARRKLKAAQVPFLDRLQVPSRPIHSQPAGRVGARGIIQGSARPRHLHVVATTKTLDWTVRPRDTAAPLMPGPVAAGSPPPR